MNISGLIGTISRLSEIGDPIVISRLLEGTLYPEYTVVVYKNNIKICVLYFKSCNIIYALFMVQYLYIRSGAFTHLKPPAISLSISSECRFYAKKLVATKK